LIIVPRDAKKTHVQLIKDRRVFEQRITDMDDQCNKMMLQKFGRIVDLEKLETVTVNRQLEELKEKLRIHEAACANELITWDVSICGRRRKLLVFAYCQLLMMLDLKKFKSVLLLFQHDSYN
jgi:hypothetical protein